MAIPTLTYNPKSRTGNEVWIYYNLGVGKRLETRVHDGTTVQTHVWTECGAGGVVPTCPAGAFNATVVELPSDGASGAIPANAQPGLAVEADLDPTSEGDTFNYVCLPDPANDVFLCQDQGFSASPGIPFTDVPVKFNAVDHRVRQRPENTLSLSDRLVGNQSGLQRIAGRPVTLIVKVSPNGTGSFSEIQYYSDVVLGPSPMNSEADGNALITSSMDGTFAFHSIFSATPT